MVYRPTFDRLLDRTEKGSFCIVECLVISLLWHLLPRSLDRYTKLRFTRKTLYLSRIWRVITFFNTTMLDYLIKVIVDRSYRRIWRLFFPYCLPILKSNFIKRNKTSRMRKNIETTKIMMYTERSKISKNLARCRTESNLVRPSK